MSERISLSIALCTYNGERFLPAQLASLAAQQRLPDELVICDDASQDGTVAVARAFAAQSPFPVRIEANPTTLGVATNFTKAIGLAQGDWIFPADQDDVWRPEKLSRLERAAAEHPRAGVVFSDANVVDENLRPQGYALWRALGVRPSERRMLTAGDGVRVLCRRNVVTGATMALHRRFRDLVLPVPSGWVHDAWIALLISAVAPVIPVGEPLIDYRQHGAQQIGGRKRGVFAQYRKAREADRDTFRDVADRFAEVLDRLSRWPDVRPDHLRTLAAKVQHARARARMREPGVWRVPAIMREYLRGNYSRYSRGWKAIAQDLFLR